MADSLAGVGSVGGKVVLIRGEAGIGKSALVKEFIRAHTDEAHILFGSCDDLLTPQPFGPFWDISRDEGSLSAPIEEGQRMAVMSALFDLLSRSLRPSILVIEDTHWADEATLDAIKYLGRRIARANGLLVLTYRDGEVDQDHPLRRVIGELPPDNLVRIHLGRLSSRAIEVLVGDAGLDVDEILELTDGNPLFVTEVLASGVDGTPLSVRDSVLARAAKLSVGARQLVDLVSVIPGEAERSLVEKILEPTRQHVDEAARQGLLLVEDETFSFHHELTRRSIESTLSTHDRRQLNQQVLSELVGGVDFARLVHHAREANSIESIIEFAPLAARAAMAIESHREAIAHFRLLEPYLDQIPDKERAFIVDDWARTEYYMIGGLSLEILARAADLHRSNGDDLALARNLTFAVRVSQIVGQPERAEACSREAIAILESYPPGPELAAAISQRAWLMKMRGHGVEAVAVAEKAIELAKDTGDELSLILALDTSGVLGSRMGDSDGFRLMDEARRRAQAAGYPFEETLALLNMAEVAIENRDVERASDLAQRARDTSARYEIRIHENAANAHYAKVLEWQGQWAKAEELAMEAMGQVLFYSQLVAGQALGPLQARQGRSAARATVDLTWARADAGDEMQGLLPAAAAMAEYMWITGEIDATLVARFLDLLSDPRRLRFPWHAGWLALWLWELGELAVAPDRIAEPYRLVINGQPIEASTFWEAKGIHYERGLALMHGQETDRLEALDIFETLGATAVVAKLRRTLRSDGIAVPRGKSRQTLSHGAGLTARQSEVLQLVAEGLSNSEIADRLFVSPRTVENHVSALLTKLDSSTRSEAVRRARDDGLLTVNAET